MDERPTVLTWLRVYAAFMALMYLACVAIGPVMIFFARDQPDAHETEGMLTGIIFIAIGLPLLVLYSLTLFMPRRPWAWIVGLVAIAIGMTSACLWPFTIPLLIFWLKPNAKEWFKQPVAG